MTISKLTTEQIEEKLENLDFLCSQVQNYRQLFAKAIMNGNFTTAMQYESDIEKQRSNFFTQLNELPVSIRIDHRMLLQRYICNMNNIPSGEPVDLQWRDYFKFKAQHQVEGMTLEEIIDLSPELTEALVIERMTEDGLFWQYHADPEGDGNV